MGEHAIGQLLWLIQRRACRDNLLHYSSLDLHDVHDRFNVGLRVKAPPSYNKDR